MHHLEPYTFKPNHLLQIDAPNQIQWLLNDKGLGSIQCVRVCGHGLPLFHHLSMATAGHLQHSVLSDTAMQQQCC